MKKIAYMLTAVYLFGTGMLLFGLNAKAYIDPSVTTYVIQAVAGIAIPVGAALGVYLRRPKKKVSERTGMEACANVDFYAGLIYELLGVPRDLFIPLFAASRVVGWIAHDIETLLYCNKIVRPATKYVGFPENEEERK